MDEALHATNFLYREDSRCLGAGVGYGWDRHIAGLDDMLLKAGAGEGPGTMNETQTLLALILTLFQKSGRDDIHFALILFCKEGSVAEVKIRCHKETSSFQSLLLNCTNRYDSEAMKREGTVVFL